MTAALAPWPYPRWFAHRGAGKLAPENTLAAFRLGTQHSYRAFECDVKLSADEVPFLLHDADLDRTTSGRGPAGDHPWHELARLDAGGWHSAAYAGIALPRLEDVARYCIAEACALNIEIKPSPGHERQTGEVVARTAGTLWRDQALKPLLSSFNPESLVAAHATAPLLPRALLLDRLRAGCIDEALALGCVAVVVRHTLLNAALIESWHGRGLRVATYTVNDAAEAQRLIDAGIDSLITDAVDRLSPTQPQPIDPQLR